MAQWQVVGTPAFPFYGPDCVITGHVRIYGYYNHDTKMDAILWVGVTNQVVHQSQFGCTEWHGSFAVLQGGAMLRVMFDCKGREGKLKSVQVLLESVCKWTGYDYRGRKITVTYKETKAYCSACRAYHAGHAERIGDP